MDGLNGNGKLLNTGHLISLLLMMAAAGGVYAALRGQIAETSRAADDLYKIVYELKKDMQDWEARESSYDAEIRARIETLANEYRETFRRQADRINEMALIVGVLRSEPKK